MLGLVFDHHGHSQSPNMPRVSQDDARAVQEPGGQPTVAQEACHKKGTTFRLSNKNKSICFAQGNYTEVIFGVSKLIKNKLY